jgi:DNA-binding LacI/PurR family transcriptional regulator
MDDRVAAWFAAEAAFTGAERPMVLSMPFDLERVTGTFLGPDPASVAHPVSRNRLAGAKDWCDEVGVDWATVRVVVLARNSQAEAFETVSAVLAEDDRPDAIMAMSDEVALGALSAAHRHALAVPDQLAITGWDGSAPATAAGLTTVEQSLYEQGRNLTLAVLGLADSVPEPTWQLVRRASTREQ